MTNTRFVLIVAALVMWGCHNNSGGSSSASPTSSAKVAESAPSNGTGSGAATKVEAAKKEESPFSLNTDKGSVVLVPHQLHLQKGVDITLNIPEGMEVGVAYEGLKRLRFMTLAPDGRLFATDMLNKSDNKKAQIYIFDDWDEGAHRFKSIKTYLDNLHNCNQVGFYSDKGKDYIYVPETGKITRYPFKRGDTHPSGAGEVVLTMPDQGTHDYKYGGWHMTRSLALHNNKLYVSIGSGCNACIEDEEMRATIMEMNLDGSERRYFARGMRNAVGIKWVGDKLWATNMGRDQIGADVPEDLFMEVKDGAYYGFPFSYQYQGKIVGDKAFKDSTRLSWMTKEVPVAFCGFKAHSAPLGFDYFKDFEDSAIKNSFLVALHGSNTVKRERGYSIVKVTGTNSYTDIVTGFLPKGSTEDKDRLGRPCDVLMRDKRSFFITDDLNGVLYLVWKK